MELPAEGFTLSAQDGTLEIRTKRTGLGARAGHDLTLEVAAWEAAVARAEDGTVHVTAHADPRTIAVREGTGGARPLGEGDRADIRTNLERKVLDVERHPRIVFQADAWEVGTETDDALAGTLTGELQLKGRSEPFSLEVNVHRAETSLHVHAQGTVVQTRWGIKPYTAFLGALKVADPVEITLHATVPAAAG
jgi:hypothetical protein